MNILTEKELKKVAGGGITLETALNNPHPNFSNEVTAPEAAIPGALNAFGRLVNNGVSIDNLNFIVEC